MIMTPAHIDSPLRRSEVGMLRENPANTNSAIALTPINDDDEERRQARRRTMKIVSDSANTSTSSSLFEENETLKKCLDIYNTNKLSRENAWSVSLIDTLSTLLERHHKSLNSFKVAGSSLEASSKVYSLRVDCIHTDVLRMSAGLNAQRFNERQLANNDDDDDGVATGGDGAADPGSPAAGANEAASAKTTKLIQKKRARKAISTITKNKDTLNARLDTVPLQDPIFGKLNLVVGSINASNRLMNNILLTRESELMLRTDFRYWDGGTLEQCNYTEAVPIPILNPNDNNVENSIIKWMPCQSVLNIPKFDELEMRPLHSGYVISDTPESITDDKDSSMQSKDIDDDERDFDDGGIVTDPPPPSSAADIACPAALELSMAFDMNAECEPLPPMDEPNALIEVDYNDFDDLTNEERTAIHRCRGLRHAAVVIEDLRPVDASSTLEYSYRPLDKISQFWAGPSHWKFKRPRGHSTMLGHQPNQEHSSGVTAANHRTRRNAQLAKKRSKQLNFNDFHDELFIKLDNKYKMRKVNVQKKWDPRKLKLPTDMQLDGNMFDKFKFAPGLAVDSGDSVAINGGDIASTDVDELQNIGALSDAAMDGAAMGGMDSDIGAGDGGGMTSEADDDGHFADDDGMGLAMNYMQGDSEGGGLGGGDDVVNNTVLEISTEYRGAPAQVTKIVVPFAKRAKVIDMKSLKRSCSQLIKQQMRRVVKDEDIPKLTILRNETYANGMSSFQELYDHLPDLLSKTMTEALTPSVALYSVLHLANDCNLRLIQHADIKDVTIRQIVDGVTTERGENAGFT